MTPATTKWIEALRSGKYQQGKCFLHQKNSKGEEYFCCLGVACNISNLATQEVHPPDAESESNVTVISYTSSNDKHIETLPESIRLLFGLRTANGSFEQDERTREIFDDCGIEYTSLSRINDLGATLEQIAKIIELCPRGLFGR